MIGQDAPNRWTADGGSHQAADKQSPAAGLLLRGRMGNHVALTGNVHKGVACCGQHPPNEQSVKIPCQPSASESESHEQCPFGEGSRTASALESPARQRHAQGSGQGENRQGQTDE